jgi:hypothetical protein
LRIPIPAEAKLAPLSNLWPLSSGFRYGNTDSDPIRLPEDNAYNCEIGKKIALQVKSHYNNLTDKVWDVEAIRETASGTMSWIIYSIRRRVCSGSCYKIVVVATIDK